MNSIGFILLCCVSLAIARNILRYDLKEAPDHFEDFIRIYNKNYDNEAELTHRYQIFLKNLEKANTLNEDSEHAVFGITKFSDLTTEEFLEKQTCVRMGYNGGQCTVQLSSNNTDFLRKSTIAPEEFDWRSKGVVSTVKNQGHCGSCWTFSVIGNVESVYAIKNSIRVTLSEQQLVDCDTSDYGCEGGFPEKAFSYLISKGVMSESDYPYEAIQGACRYNANSARIKLSQCLSISAQEDQLPHKLFSTAPLSIVIDATSVRGYNRGIISGNSCTGSTVNHAVLLVGYGTDNGTPYWLIKNSWGADWGENGYFRMQRGVNCLLVMQYPALSAVV